MNPLIRLITRLVPPILIPKAWWSAYEGANFSTRRARTRRVEHHFHDWLHLRDADHTRRLQHDHQSYEC
jgi:hypothetical protein